MLQWADVLKDKSLQNLPYKIELDAKGRIIMTPASNRHGMYQIEIGARLKRMMPGGRVFSECSIKTLDGVKVADVAWASNEFLKKYREQTPFTHAPEICVEIVSPSNRRAEMEEKITLYLAKGAREVWLCDEKGNVTFADHSGKLKKSKLVARFPSKI
ncbi:MAG: Uma2 family endonuclease [Anaerolineales bacterium]|nr:Uma2 family endonuclease [Anaerolineales bacterium]